MTFLGGSGSPRYAYPEDLSMAEAAATEMALPWEPLVVDLKEVSNSWK